MLARHGFEIDPFSRVPRPVPEKLETFENKVARLLYQGKNVSFGEPEKVRMLLGDHNEYAIQAFKNMYKLLTKWGLYQQDAPHFHAGLDDVQENILLQSMHFGKGKGDAVYGDKRWSAISRREALLYDFGFETEATLEPVIEQLEYMIFSVNGSRALFNRSLDETEGSSGLVSIFMPNDTPLDLYIHRKPVTATCQQAVDARIDALGAGVQGVPIENEIKSILFKMHSQKTGQPHLLAFHTHGAREEIDPAIFFEEHARFQMMKEKLGLDNPVFDKSLAEDIGLATGRVNAFTLEKRAMEIGVPLLQCFDVQLLSEKRTGFTNIGSNSWGVQATNTQRYVLAAQHQTDIYNRPYKYGTLVLDIDEVELVHTMRRKREQEELGQEFSDFLAALE